MLLNSRMILWTCCTYMMLQACRGACLAERSHYLYWFCWCLCLPVAPVNRRTIDRQRSPWLNTSDLNLWYLCLCASENSAVKHWAQFIRVYSFKSNSHVSSHRSINITKYFWAPQFSLSAETRFHCDFELCLSNRTTNTRATLQPFADFWAQNYSKEYFKSVSHRSGWFNFTLVCHFQHLVHTHCRFTTRGFKLLFGFARPPTQRCNGGFNVS